jgi:hypothetical protein
MFGVVRHSLVRPGVDERFAAVDDRAPSSEKSVYVTTSRRGVSAAT